MPDRIELRGLRAWGHHGVLPEERERGQVFRLDVDLELDLSAAASTDHLADTVHYGELAEALVDEVAATRFDLLEALAGHLAQRILRDDRIDAVEVRVAKPHAPVAADLAEVAVVVQRRTRRPSPRRLLGLTEEG